MNFKIFAFIFGVLLSILATSMAGDKGGTIIIGQNGGMIVKGGKKVSLFNLIL